MTNNGLQYKGYTGSAVFDWERKIVHGRVQFIDDLVTYESPSVEGLEREFRAAVDDYIATCKQLNREPKRAFNGVFNVRTLPEKHQRLAAIANARGLSLNAVLNIGIDMVLSSADEGNQHDSADDHHRLQIDEDVQLSNVALTSGTIAAPSHPKAHPEFRTIIKCNSSGPGVEAFQKPTVAFAGGSIAAYSVSGSQGRWVFQREHEASFLFGRERAKSRAHPKNRAVTAGATMTKVNH